MGDFVQYGNGFLNRICKKRKQGNYKALHTAIIFKLQLMNNQRISKSNIKQQLVMPNTAEHKIKTNKYFQESGILGETYLCL